MALELPEQVDITQHNSNDLAASFGLDGGYGTQFANDQQATDTGGEVQIHPHETIDPVYGVPLKPLSIRDNGDGTADIAFNMAKFVSIHALGMDVFDVAFNGVVVDGNKTTLITIPFPSALTVTVYTDNMGAVYNDPVGITTGVAPWPLIPAQLHHVPPSWDGTDSEGRYSWVVASIIDDNGPKWVPENTSLTWNDYTREIENMGGGAYIHMKTTDTAKDELRSLVTDPDVSTPSGSNVKNVKVIPTEDGNEIKFVATVDVGSGSGSSSLPYTIYLAGFGILTLTQDVIYDLYDPDIHNNWSIEFEVDADQFNAMVAYNTEVERFPVDGAGEQTHYRLPVVRNGVVVSSGGCYQEDITCVNGEAMQQLYKIG